MLCAIPLDIAYEKFDPNQALTMYLFSMSVMSMSVMASRSLSTDTALG